MTHEININVSLIVEADVEQEKSDFENFVRRALTGAGDGEKLSLYNYQINWISEEAKIYGQDPEREDGIWEFVEKYYPNYYSCDEIMRKDSLCKIANGELSGDAQIIFTEEFGENLELAIAAYGQSNRHVYQRAIAGYLGEQLGKITIVWSIGDVEDRAKDRGYLLKDGQAQQVLDMLKDRHDCTIAITWDVIDDYLGYIVPEPGNF